MLCYECRRFQSHYVRKQREKHRNIKSRSQARIKRRRKKNRSSRRKGLSVISFSFFLKLLNLKNQIQKTKFNLK